MPLFDADQLRSALGPPATGSWWCKRRSTQRYPLLVSVLMVHAVNDGLVSTIAGGRDQHALGAILKMRQAFLFAGENAGAFHARYRHRPTAVRPDCADAVTRIGPRPTSIQSSPVVTTCGKRPCTESKRSKCALVSTGPRSLIAITSISVRPEFDDRAQHVAADPAKSVDGDFDGHSKPPEMSATHARLASANITKSA